MTVTDDMLRAERDKAARARRQTADSGAPSDEASTAREASPVEDRTATRSGSYLSTSGSVESFAAPPVANTSKPETIETPSGVFKVAPASAAWKARSSVGIVYDFPDRNAVRTWLSGRDSHDGISVSFDGGTEWYTPAEIAGIRDVAPGSRIGRTTGSLRPVAPARPPADADTQDADASASEQSQSTSDPDSPTRTTGRSQTFTGTSETVSAGSRTMPPRTRQHTGQTRSAADEARAAVEAKRRKADQRAEERAAKRKGNEDEKTTRYALLAVLFIVAVGAGAWMFGLQRVDTGFPNTPVGVEAAWALGIVNSDVETITAATVEPHLDPAIVREVGVEVFVEQLRYFASTRSSYELVDFIDRPTSTRIDAEIRTNAMERGVMTVVVADAPPHLIIGLQFQGDYAFAPTFR